MKITAPKRFLHMTLGSVEKDTVIEVEKNEALRLIAMGLVVEVKEKKVEDYETKVITAKPTKTVKK